jgi:hypothetical protein
MRLVTKTPPRLSIKGMEILPPKREQDSETSWADPWAATRPAQEAVMGREITDAINAEPDEVQRLRIARADARAGRRYRLRDVISSS